MGQYTVTPSYLLIFFKFNISLLLLTPLEYRSTRALKTLKNGEKAQYLSCTAAGCLGTAAWYMGSSGRLTNFKINNEHTCDNNLRLAEYMMRVFASIINASNLYQNPSSDLVSNWNALALHFNKLSGNPQLGLQAQNFPPQHGNKFSTLEPFVIKDANQNDPNGEFRKLQDRISELEAKLRELNEGNLADLFTDVPPTVGKLQTTESIVPVRENQAPSQEQLEPLTQEPEPKNKAVAQKGTTPTKRNLPAPKQGVLKRMKLNHQEKSSPNPKKKTGNQETTPRKPQNPPPNTNNTSPQRGSSKELTK